MTSTDTRDRAATVRQIKRLVAAGCDIVRVAVPDQAAARQLGAIKAAITVPLVADIHFDYRLALAAIEQGVDKVRINPGNIGSAERVRIVAARARERKIPIRVGANAGSLGPEFRKRYADPARALAASALAQARLLERAGFEDIVLSLKSSDVVITRDAYRRVAQSTSYPLHVGITEAGLAPQGLVTSAIGIGGLLAEGIGDTIRVSLTGDPVDEIWAGKAILRALGLRRDRPYLVACPTCGRCRIDLVGLARRVDRALETVRRPLTVAVMGCEVNGPGEARTADVGVAGGRGCGLIFRRGRVVRKVPAGRIVPALLAEMAKL